MNIVIIDGQGGQLGSQLVKEISAQSYPDSDEQMRYFGSRHTKSEYRCSDRRCPGKITPNLSAKLLIVFYIYSTMNSFLKRVTWKQKFPYITQISGNLRYYEGVIISEEIVALLRMNGGI